MTDTKKKLVPVTLVLHTWLDVDDDENEESIRFRVEEHLCRDNFIIAEQRRIDVKPNTCSTCIRSRAFARHIDFDLIEEVPDFTRANARIEDVAARNTLTCSCGRVIKIGRGAAAICTCGKRIDA